MSLRYCTVLYIICTHAFADADEPWFNFEPMFEKHMKNKIQKKSNVEKINAVDYEKVWKAIMLYAVEYDVCYSNKTTGYVECNKSPVPNTSMTIGIDSKSLCVHVKISDNESTMDYSIWEKKIAQFIQERAKNTG